MSEKKSFVGVDKEENGEKKYKIRGGLIKREDGSLGQTKMFDILEIPLDDYSDLEFTESEVKRMRMHVMKLKTGIQAMAPLLCAGPVKCPFRYRCPLVDRSIKTLSGKDIDFTKQNLKAFPIMRQCIFERELLDFQRKQYIQEYDVDLESPTELGMANRLAEIDLYEMRATIVLANGDEKQEGQDLLKRQTTSVSMTGEELKRMEVHPAFELKARLAKMCKDILTSMVGTRQEKYKQAAALKKEDFSDPSSVMSSLKARIIEMSSAPTIDADFTEQPVSEDDNKEG